jgi:thiol-disulfide isomerase/thioredoxin
VSELPPFQLEVRYQLDPGVATGPDGVPEDLEALMTVSYGGPDLLRVDVNRNVQLFFPEPNREPDGEPGPPHKAAGSFVILNHDSKAEYSAEDGTFFLGDKNFFNPLDPLLWETWEDICTYSEHEFLDAAPVAGRKAVHIRCTNGNDSYELWVDAETGLMLRIVGKDIPGNLILISSGIQATEYEVLSVAYEPLFAPDTFSLSAPQGATVEDLRGVDDSMATEILPEGATVPELTGQLLAGGDFTLADLKGNRVALLFWGSWCEPCLNALGELAVVAKERPDITFVTVLIDDRPEDASAVLAERQIILPAVDPDGMSGNWYEEQWRGDGIPLLFLIEADGTVAAHHKGFGPLDLFQAILSDAGW